MGSCNHSTRQGAANRRHSSTACTNQHSSTAGGCSRTGIPLAPINHGAASSTTASGETALFVSPGTIRSLKAGTGVALSTASKVVTVSATPYVAFRLTGNAISATVNLGLSSSGTVTLQAGRRPARCTPSPSPTPILLE